MTDEERAVLFLAAQQGGVSGSREQVAVLAAIADWPEARAVTALEHAADAGLAARKDEDESIAGTLRELAADGRVGVEIVDGEERFNLTDQGLTGVISDVFGGRDIHNSSAALWELLQKHGTILGTHDGVLEEPWMFLVMQRVVSIYAQFFRELPEWRRIVETLERELPEKWWTVNSRAFIDFPDQSSTEPQA